MWMSFSTSPSRRRDTGIPVQAADDEAMSSSLDLLLHHRRGGRLGARLELLLELGQHAVANLGDAGEVAGPLLPIGLHA